MNILNAAELYTYKQLMYQTLCQALSIYSVAQSTAGRKYRYSDLMFKDLLFQAMDWVLWTSAPTQSTSPGALDGVYETRHSNEKPSKMISSK